LSVNQPTEHRHGTNATDQTTESTSKGKAHRLAHQGNINATVFENHGANGTFYTVDIQRSYLVGEGENAER
jgi:hypothetical protein